MPAYVQRINLVAAFTSVVPYSSASFPFVASTIFRSLRVVVSWLWCGVFEIVLVIVAIFSICVGKTFLIVLFTKNKNELRKTTSAYRRNGFLEG